MLDRQPLKTIGESEVKVFERAKSELGEAIIFADVNYTHQEWRILEVINNLRKNGKNIG